MHWSDKPKTSNGLNDSMHQEFFYQLAADYNFIRSRTIGKENTCEGQGSPILSVT